MTIRGNVSYGGLNLELCRLPDPYTLRGGIVHIKIPERWYINELLPSMTLKGVMETNRIDLDLR